jgi:DNA invertase Pin-like site-specific DNA recombinase
MGKRPANAPGLQYEQKRSGMKRAIGIVRVSEVAGRDGDRFHSPTIQRERIERDCQQYGLRLAEVIEELDVSGGKALGQRKGLARALAAVESGQVEAIVFAYRDRMDRSIDTASELCRRMDAAGGLLVADGQVISHATHDGWRRATFESFLNEDQRRAVSAKMRDVHIRNITHGVAPFILPRGYRRRANGVAELDPRFAPLILAAWKMRAEKASIPEIRAMLLKRGLTMPTSAVTRMFANRFYLGELHYRGVIEPNLAAHEPLVDPETWRSVQRVRGTLGGRRARSERLLARQGVLLCATCRRRMSLSTKAQRKSPFYRCTNFDCERRVAIVANIAEQVVSDAVRAALADAEGRASMAESAQEAASALERAQRDLDTAMRSFAAAGLENEAAAVERLVELRQARDVAQERVDQIGTGAARTVNAAGDWDELSLAGRRELIRATVESAIVAPTGRGAERIAVRLLGQ